MQHPASSFYGRNPELQRVLGHPRILVLGDAMLDRYTWGRAERVSPEAPVLILNVDERDVRLGGAASVAVLLRALEAETTLASVIGDDHDGRTISRLIDEAGIKAAPTLLDPCRPTTVKERFLGRCEQRQSHRTRHHHQTQPSRRDASGAAGAAFPRIIAGVAA